MISKFHSEDIIQGTKVTKKGKNAIITPPIVFQLINVSCKKGLITPIDSCILDSINFVLQKELGFQYTSIKQFKVKGLDASLCDVIISIEKCVLNKTRMYVPKIKLENYEVKQSNL